MKYSLSCRQSKEFLQQTDEIYIEYRDFNIFPDLIDSYPDKDFLLIMQESDDVLIEDWDFIAVCAKRVNLEVECDTFNHYAACTVRGIPFCPARIIDSFFDLQNWIDMGATSVHIGPSLFFQMKDLLQRNIKIRFTPNVVNNNQLRPLNKNWMSAPWIRPEDIELYSGTDNICQFHLSVPERIKQEQALFNVYKAQKWLGSLSQIIYGLESSCRSAALPDEFGKQRLSCRNRCKINPDSCHYCETCESLMGKLQPGKEKLH